MRVEMYLSSALAGDFPLCWVISCSKSETKSKHSFFRAQRNVKRPLKLDLRFKDFGHPIACRPKP